MRALHKYQIDYQAENFGTTRMPAGAQVLSCDLQNGSLVVWALVDPELPVDVVRTFLIAFTGYRFIPPRTLDHVATLTDRFGLVTHVCEINRPADPAALA